MSFEIQSTWISNWGKRSEDAYKTAAILLCFPGPVFWSFGLFRSIYAREYSLLFQTKSVI